MMVLRTARVLRAYLWLWVAVGGCVLAGFPQQCRSIVHDDMNARR